jgi:3-hydroxybutyrate dehydrogenase
VMLAGAAIKRLLKPSDIANFVSYLCGEQAGGITGTLLSIDCGWTAR